MLRNTRENRHWRSHVFCLVQMMAQPQHALWLALLLLSPLVLSFHQPQLQHTRSIPIRFETDELLVIDKPAGVAHHDKEEESSSSSSSARENSESGHYDSTTMQKGIFSRLRDEYPHLRSNNNSNDDTKLYGVHRLDQVTSGLLVVAKTPAMARCLTQAFTNRKVVKYYTGLSSKAPKKKKQGWVNGYMQRGRRKSWYLTTTTTTTQQSENSKKASSNDSAAAAAAVWAKTYFWTAGLGNLDKHYHGPSTGLGEVEEKGSSYQANTLTAERASVRLPTPRTLILFRPYTGRTHQLRVASKSLGLPLLGDPLYTTTTDISSSGDTTNNNNHNSLFPRTCLHATGLHIPKECLQEAGMEQDLTLWSPPPFFQWWQDDDEHQQQQPNILRLLEKDASVPKCLFEAALLAAPTNKASGLFVDD